MPNPVHQFGPPSVVRFIPAHFTGSNEPTFFIVAVRVCLGEHDPKCNEAETFTFGPLTLTGATMDQVFRCPSCGRFQPPLSVDPNPGSEHVCLYCADTTPGMRTVTPADTDAALAAVAALVTAATMCRVDAEYPIATGSLLAGNGESIRFLMERTAMEIKQAPERAAYAGNKVMVRIARQIMANARKRATEPFPVRENDDE